MRPARRRSTGQAMQRGPVGTWLSWRALRGGPDDAPTRALSGAYARAIDQAVERAVPLRLRLPGQGTDLRVERFPPPAGTVEQHGERAGPVVVQPERQQPG